MAPRNKDQIQHAEPQREAVEAAIGPSIEFALAGRGLLKSLGDYSRQITDEFVLGVDDDEFGYKIRETRVYPPGERKTDARISRLRTRMELAGVLDDSPAGERNKARLRKLQDEPAGLYELEEEFLEDDDRKRNGEWLSPLGFIVHPEAVEVTSFVLATYRRDLIGFRIAVVMAKEIPPVNRRRRHGTMTKLPGKMRYLSQYDALMTLDWSSWVHMTDKDRQRLVHHELLHLEVGEKRTLQLRAHDFEDFADCIDIYGLHSETKMFPTDGHVGEVLRNASAQLELLPRSA